MATKVKPSNTPAAALQLHIELRHLTPKIWRRVLVPRTITLARLHSVIQVAFQWDDDHLHEFKVAGQRYSVSYPDYDEPGAVKSEQTQLMKAIAPGRTIDYVYDFGDNWELRVKVEKEPPPTDRKLPLCIAGANAAPPEDSGGVPGYAVFVEIMADPSHPEHGAMKEWFGDDWDAAAFDMDHVNRRLQRIKV